VIASLGTDKRNVMNGRFSDNDLRGIKNGLETGPLARSVINSR
jgi:hypothetical protein